MQDLKDRIGDVSMAWAPMLGEKRGVGSIAVLRQPPKPFSSKELSLLKTFADQAVIAIENARLFNETQGGAGAADRHGRHPEGDRQFAVGRAAGAADTRHIRITIV